MTDRKAELSLNDCLNLVQLKLEHLSSRFFFKDTEKLFGSVSKRIQVSEHVKFWNEK